MPPKKAKVDTFSPATSSSCSTSSSSFTTAVAVAVVKDEATNAEVSHAVPEESKSELKRKVSHTSCHGTVTCPAFNRYVKMPAGLYTGTLKYGKRFGHGTTIFEPVYSGCTVLNCKVNHRHSRTTVHVGDWQNQEFHGKGIFIQISVDEEHLEPGSEMEKTSIYVTVYKGHFANSRKHGRLVRMDIDLEDLGNHDEVYDWSREKVVAFWMETLLAPGFLQQWLENAKKTCLYDVMDGIWYHGNFVRGVCYTTLRHSYYEPRVGRYTHKRCSLCLFGGIVCAVLTLCLWHGL